MLETDFIMSRRKKQGIIGLLVIFPTRTGRSLTASSCAWIRKLKRL